MADDPIGVMLRVSDFIETGEGDCPTMEDFIAARRELRDRQSGMYSQPFGASLLRSMAIEAVERVRLEGDKYPGTRALAEQMAEALIADGWRPREWGGDTKVALLDEIAGRLQAELGARPQSEPDVARNRERIATLTGLLVWWRQYGDG